MENHAKIPSSNAIDLEVSLTQPQTLLSNPKKFKRKGDFHSTSSPKLENLRNIEKSVIDDRRLLKYNDKN